MGCEHGLGDDGGPCAERRRGPRDRRREREIPGPRRRGGKPTRHRGSAEPAGRGGTARDPGRGHRPAGPQAGVGRAPRPLVAAAPGPGPERASATRRSASPEKARSRPVRRRARRTCGRGSGVWVVRCRRGERGCSCVWFRRPRTPRVASPPGRPAAFLPAMDPPAPRAPHVSPSAARPPRIFLGRGDLFTRTPYSIFVDTEPPIRYIDRCRPGRSASSREKRASYLGHHRLGVVPGPAPRRQEESMSSQTAGAVPGPSHSWSGHGADVVVAESCATRFSLARGATGAAPCKAPVGGGVGGPRADRGSCAPAAGAVAPSSMPGAPRDFPRPPLRHATELLSKSIAPSPPSAGKGEGRAVPASQSHPDHPAREAGPKEENHR
jgi:hypothetical protein